MNDLVLANRAADWRRLKALVLDSVSSPDYAPSVQPGARRIHEWYGRETRPGFTNATVYALEARGLGAVFINVRITPVRQLAVEAADNGCWHRSWPPASRA